MFASKVFATRFLTSEWARTVHVKPYTLKKKWSGNKICIY